MNPQASPHHGARSLTQQLLDALEHPDPALRRRGIQGWVEVLEALGPAAGGLTARLDDEEPGVREAAVRGLEALGTQAALVLPQVRATLERLSLGDRQDADLRTAAAKALSAMGRRPDLPLGELVQALQDPAAPVRFGAAQALGDRGADGGPAVGALLQLSLHDADPAVRLEAAIALYKIDGRTDTILPLLLRVLREPDEARRWIAAERLREMGPAAREAVPVLLETLDGDFKSVMVRNSFLLALNRIDPDAAARAGYELSG